MKIVDRRLCIAPMLEYTDRYYRSFIRHITLHTLNFTEMIPSQAIHYNYERTAELLISQPIQSPCALQWGGSDPAILASATQRALDYNYAEFNLNVGCPSPRVAANNFGACLMTQPDLVAECLRKMAEVAGEIPVSIKHRIAVTGLEGYDNLVEFVSKISEDSGCKVFYVHGRKAVLEPGWTPKDNRSIPPLKPEEVYTLKKDFPDLEIIYNGGVKTLNEAKKHLEHVDGVMIGRAAYDTPYELAYADSMIFDDNHPIPSRYDVAMGFAAEADLLTERFSTKAGNVTKHLAGLYNAVPGGNRFDKFLGANQFNGQKASETIRGAVFAVEKYLEEVRDHPRFAEKINKALQIEQ